MGSSSSRQIQQAASSSTRLSAACPLTASATFGSVISQPETSFEMVFLLTGSLCSLSCIGASLLANGPCSIILLVVVSFVWQILHRTGTGKTGDDGEVVLGAGAGA